MKRSITLACALALTLGASLVRAEEPATRPLASVLEDLQSKEPFPHFKGGQELARLLPADPNADLSAFLPAVKPLLSFLGWGGAPGRSESEMAESLLIRLGKTALPDVLKTLHKADRIEQRVCCIRILAAVDRKQALVVLPDILAEACLRRQAIRTLGPFGKDALPAADKITQYLSDPDLMAQIYSRSALVRITGKPSPYVEGLAAMAMDPRLDPTGQQGNDAQTFAASELWGLGDQASSTYPLFIKAFTSPDRSIRHLAVGAFNSSGPVAPEIVAGLVTVLEREQDADIRVLVCGALATIGPPARDAAPALVKVLARDEKDTGWLCVMALKNFDSDDASFAAVLHAAHSKQTQTRIDVAYYLSRFAKRHPKEVHESLIALSSDRDPNVRIAAAQARTLLDGIPFFQPDSRKIAAESSTDR